MNFFILENMLYFQISVLDTHKNESDTKDKTQENQSSEGNYNPARGHSHQGLLNSACSELVALLKQWCWYTTVPCTSSCVNLSFCGYCFQWCHWSVSCSDVQGCPLSSVGVECHLGCFCSGAFIAPSTD